MFGIFSLFYILLFNPAPFTGGDNADYISLAQGLTKHGKFCAEYLPGTPEEKVRPFGFPLLIAPFSSLSTLVPMKIEIGLFGISVLLLLFLSFSKTETGLYTVFIFTFYFPFIKYNSLILSEIPFMFFIYLSLYLMVKKSSYLSIVPAIYAYFIRSAGLTIVLSLWIYLLIKKKFKALLIYSFIFLTLAGIWQWRNSRIKGGTETTYIEQFLSKNPYAPEMGKVNIQDIIRRIKTNFLYYTHLKNNKFGLLSLIILFIFIYGFYLKLIKKDILAIFLLFYLGLILIWPQQWRDVRFILPVFPLILFHVFFAIKKLEEKSKISYLSFVFFIASLIFFSISTIKSIPYYLNVKKDYIKGDILSGYPEPIKKYYTSALWARKNTDKNAIFMARKPSMYWLFSKRQCVIYPFTNNVQKTLKTIEKYKVDYIAYDGIYSTTRAYLLPALKNIQNNLTPIYKNKYVYILKMKRAAKE